eukprot:TRINITY_DN7847_c0_g1_i2.p1 TRINITY_DN7847_c0_g1~~TRINITY_DN7847_c0_g1_i2.p1  ORF type:complete len:178 (+),score=65.13 TRINITY_DN7847_c0_g1_i2:29-535(+)
MDRKDKIAEFKKKKEQEQQAKKQQVVDEKKKLDAWYQDSDPITKAEARIQSLRAQLDAIPPNPKDQGITLLRQKVECALAVAENLKKEEVIKQRLRESRARQLKMLEDLEVAEEKLRSAKEEDARLRSKNEEQETELQKQTLRLNVLLKMKEAIDKGEVSPEDEQEQT